MRTKKGAWMMRFVLLALLAVLSFSLPAPAFAQAEPLPPVDSQGNPGPLAIDQLTPEERTRYDALAPASDDARQFLYTRGFLRFCRLVVAGTLPPLQLPSLPAREDWDRQFLSADEAANVVDVALGMSMMAMLGPPRPAPPIDPALAQGSGLPGLDAQGEALPLSIDLLAPDERAAFDRLPLGGDAAKRFLYTRGYLRYCRLVADGKIDPLSLPPLPAEENWDRAFLTAEEGRNVVDVALGRNMVAQMRPQ
jgi:hypothetical protein